MKQDIQRIMLAAAKPLFPIFILYILKIMEVGMDWDFSRLGVYPMEKRGLVGILTHPLIHSGWVKMPVSPRFSIGYTPKREKSQFIPTSIILSI